MFKKRLFAQIFKNLQLKNMTFFISSQFQSQKTPKYELLNNNNESMIYDFQSHKTLSMKYELFSMSNFLVHLIRLAKTGASESQLTNFRNSLVEVFHRRYKEYWFPDKPFKGSGYRCIRINNKMDPVIAQAGKSCGFSSTFLHSNFPCELTMWIDPGEVSYRIGENGSICILYDGNENEPWVPSFLRKKKNMETCNLKASAITTETPYCMHMTSSYLNYLLDAKQSVTIEILASMVSG